MIADVFAATAIFIDYVSPFIFLSTYYAIDTPLFSSHIRCYAIFAAIVIIYIIS